MAGRAAQRIGGRLAGQHGVGGRDRDPGAPAGAVKGLGRDRAGGVGHVVAGLADRRGRIGAAAGDRMDVGDHFGRGALDALPALVDVRQEIEIFRRVDRRDRPQPEIFGPGDRAAGGAARRQAAARHAPAFPDWAAARRSTGKPSGHGASVRRRRRPSCRASLVVVAVAVGQRLERVAIGGMDAGRVGRCDDAEPLIETLRARNCPRRRQAACKRRPCARVSAATALSSRSPTSARESAARRRGPGHRRPAAPARSKSCGRTGTCRRILQRSRQPVPRMPRPGAKPLRRRSSGVLSILCAAPRCSPILRIAPWMIAASSGVAGRMVRCGSATAGPPGRNDVGALRRPPRPAGHLPHRWGDWQRRRHATSRSPPLRGRCPAGQRGAT